MSKIQNLITFALNDKTNTYSDVNFGTVPNFQAQEINAKTHVNVRGCKKHLTASGIRHAFAGHGNAELEKRNNQIAITNADFELLPSILDKPDYLEKGNNNRRGNEAVVFVKNIKGHLYHVVMSVVKYSDENRLVFNTMYIKK